MQLANRHLEEALNEFIEKILEEGRSVTREKAAERIRAKLPDPQTKLEEHKKGKGIKEEEHPGRKD